MSGSFQAPAQQSTSTARQQFVRMAHREACPPLGLHACICGLARATAVHSIGTEPLGRLGNTAASPQLMPGRIR